MSVESGLQLLLWLVVVPGCTAALLLWMNNYPKKNGESARLSRLDKPGAGVPGEEPYKPTVVHVDMQRVVIPTTLPSSAGPVPVVVEHSPAANGTTRDWGSTLR